jgi:hypothetical protein
MQFLVHRKHTAYCESHRNTQIHCAWADCRDDTHTVCL